MSTFRYVVTDVFTDTPLAGNQLAVFTDARDIPERAPAAAREGDGVSARPSSSTRPMPKPMCGSGSSHRRKRSPSPAIRRSGRRWCRAAHAAREWSRSRRAQASFGLTRARRPEDRLRPDAASRPDDRALRRGAPLLAALGVERSELAVELYDEGMRFVYVALHRSEDEVAGSTRTPARSTACPSSVGVNCFAGSGGRWKPACSRPARGVDRDPATGLRGRAARRPPRAPRPDRLGRRGRDLAGRGGRPPVDVRAHVDGFSRRDGTRRGRRVGRGRRSGRVQALARQPVQPTLDHVREPRRPVHLRDTMSTITRAVGRIVSTRSRSRPGRTRGAAGWS